MGHARAAVLAVALAAVAAGCSSGGSSTANTPPTSFPPITTPPTSTAPTPSATATTAPTSKPPVTSTACGSGELSLSLGSSQGAAGNFYQAIVLTNTSGASCTLRGYPGVSFVDASDTQLGPAAGRSGGRIHTITLAAHGGQASALLHTVDAGNYDPSTCHPQAAARLRVYPPNQTRSLLVSDHQQVCTTNVARPSISALVAGDTGGQ